MKFIGLRAVYIALASLALAACGGGGGDSGSGGSGGVTPTYTITATFTGLTAAVTTVYNGSPAANVPANSTSVLVVAGLASGTAYTITLQGLPVGLGCGPVTAGANVGTIGTANVTIAFSCAPTYVVGGSITGLTVAGLQVRLFPDFAGSPGIAGFNVAPARNATSYQFGIQVRGDISYIARIIAQPAGLTCRFANNTVDSTAPMNNAAVQLPITCVAGSGPSIYTVGGTVAGHAGGNVVLRLNNSSGTDQTIAPGTGSFTFAGTPLATGIPYAVSLVSSPSGQACSVDNGIDTIGTANVTNVAVTCSAVTTGFTIGGAISGNTGSVGLSLNGSNGLLAAGPNFTFPNPLGTGAAYNVLITTPPAGQTCVLGNPSGTVANANVANINVTCTTQGSTFTIGGTINGNTAPVTLRLNGTTDQTFAGGAFTFTSGLAQGTSYTVQVLTPPTGQVCTPASNAGVVPASNVTNVVITCAQTGGIAGNVSGLTGSGLVLQLNGGNDVTVAPSSAIFGFQAGVLTGGAYTVHIKTQPAGQTCTIIRAFGNIGASSTNITTSNPLAPAIACVDNVTSPLSGTFAIPSVPIRAFLTFYPDGTYIFGVHNDDPTCTANNGNGLEYGVYNWNATTKAFALVTAAIDGNGDCGLVNGTAFTTGTIVKNVDGTLSADFIDTNGSGDHFVVTLVPVASTTGSIAGSWGDNQGFAVYSSNGTLFSAQTKGLAQNVNFPPGIEDGCYALTGTPAAGSYTANFSASCHVNGTQVGVDTTGLIGISVLGSNPWNFTVTGDLIQLAPAPATPGGAGIPRIVTN
jgi:hypothetical protein